jgi:hypothetical protein
MSKLSGLGEITSNFLLNDFSVYIMNTSATGGYTSTDWDLLGFTSAEKNINRVQEKYEREDKIPRVITYSKTIRKGLEVTYDLSNFNTGFAAELSQATKISLGGTGTRLVNGTSESTKVYRAMMFSSVLDSGEIYNIVIPKCDNQLAGEQTVGGEEESKWPILSKAVYNPAANATANLYYEEWLSSSVNATSSIPPGF